MNELPKSLNTQNTFFFPNAGLIVILGNANLNISAETVIQINGSVPREIVDAIVKAIRES